MVGGDAHIIPLYWVLQANYFLAIRLSWLMSDWLISWKIQLESKTLRVCETHICELNIW